VRASAFSAFSTLRQFLNRARACGAPPLHPGRNLRFLHLQIFAIRASIITLSVDSLKVFALMSDNDEADDNRPLWVRKLPSASEGSPPNSPKPNLVPAAPAPAYSSLKFFLEDYPRTLFPLSTNKIIVENGELLIKQYLEDCKAGKKNFLPQQRVYAAKDGIHLRRTVKLDPVSEYFIYDFVYKNRKIFKKPHNKDKMHYGYRFENGVPTSPSEAYKQFKDAVWLDSQLSLDAFVGFDIATYFNSLYHHDLEAWLAALDATSEDVDIFSKFLRETNAGRSVDCLPQGLYPTKMIGNDFLRFIEESMFIKSSNIRRFMDDFYIFGNSMDEVLADFYHIQKIAGQKGLSINPSKTSIDRTNIEKTENSISDVKKNLLKRRRLIVKESFEDGDEEESDEEIHDLNREELAEIHRILQGPHLEEEDAELILTVMRAHSDDVVDKIPDIINKFPNLAKNVYKFCAEIDKNKIADIILESLQNNVGIQEFQLFWFGVMLENYLLQADRVGELMRALLVHPNATDVSKAKILEIPDTRFGLTEMRAYHLASGKSDWLSWSSAVGSRSLKPAARNYALSYFMKSSDMNYLIGDIVKKLL
jgi:hypothetical protein